MTKPHMTPASQTACRGLGVLIALCLMVMLPLPRAQAQLGDVAQAMEPEFFTRDLLIFIEGLDLDETQSVIAEAIFDAYESQFIDGKEQMEMEINDLTTELQSLRDRIDNDKILEMVVQPIQDWIVRRQGLNDRLIENIRVILLPEQQERWTAFARKLYRSRKLDSGRLSGERVDLFLVFMAVNIDLRLEPAKSVMVDYSIRLDQALRARQRLIEGESKDLLNILRSRQSDPEGDIETKRKIEKARIAVRDVNDRYRTEIVAVLSREQGRLFELEALRLAYPKIYRTTNAERVFNDALDNYAPGGMLEDSNVHEAILGLYKEFLAELAMLNSKMYEATRSSEPELALARIENSLLRQQGRPLVQPEDPMRELQQTRRELEREYIDKLRALLGDDNFAHLNGAARYLPPPKFDPANPNSNHADRLLQLHNPAGGTGGKSKGPEGGKPDGRPDAPAKGLGRGAGVGAGGGSDNN